VGILNINGFYDHLIKFMDHMVLEGLLKQENREMLLISDSIEDLLDKMENYEASEITKWIDKNEIGEVV